jgi:hypothetical protein
MLDDQRYLSWNMTESNWIYSHDYMYDAFSDPEQSTCVDQVSFIANLLGFRDTVHRFVGFSSFALRKC